MAPSDLIGRPLRRVEDGRFIRGEGRYVDDITRPGLLHLVFLRSPHAHARIARIDTKTALAAPGVVAVLTARDVEGIPPVPVIEAVPDIAVPPRPLLAAERVLAVGALVAAVVADDPARARDAAERIEVEYEPLAPVVTAEAALGPGAPRLAEPRPTNRAFGRAWRAGDPAAAFREAARVERLRVEQNRVAGVPIEPRGVLAEYDPGAGMLTVWISIQNPFSLRADLAKLLGVPEHRIRVVAPDVGGGFGVKEATYPEDVVVALAALRLRRPVKWIATRSEDFQATKQGRGAVAEAEIALTAEGRITALRARIVASVGAYLVASAAIPPTRHATLLTGAYAIPSVEIEMTAALTNTAPSGAYRGAGRPEAAFLIERLVDQAARALALDPAELRRRNFIPPTAFPYRTPMGLVLDSGDYAPALDRALRLTGYDELRARQREARARGEIVGVGLASYIEPSAGGWESGTVRVERNGEVTVVTGSCATGQGHETTFGQIVADRLGVRLADVRVRAGLTDGAPQGIGTFGSRSTTLGGSALARASDMVVEKGRRLAAALFEAEPADVVFDGGAFHVAGVPDRRAGWREVAGLAYRRAGVPGGLEPGLEATAFFQGAHEVYGFGTCVAVVRIDGETGVVTLERIVLVDDCGTVVNPLLVEGQLHGGLAQGLGQALLEQVVYDASGQLLTGTLMDYALAGAADVPPFVLDRTRTPSPLNPLGAKGVGEAGTIAAPPAIVNAVMDALAPFGVATLDMPLTPQKIWNALRGRRAPRY